MTSHRAIVTLLTVAALAHPGAAASKPAKPVRAGVARVEITPPLGLPMYGYAGRKSGATGVLDPLMARVLVLEAGETRLALVVLDLGEPPAAQWIQRLRDRVGTTSGLTHVLVSATHTHSGPDIRDVFPPANGPDWESAMLDKVAGAIDQAHRQAVDATMGTGYGNVLIGHNRLRLERDGTIQWFERNNTMVPTSPVDPTVSVLRVDALDGTPIAVLMNYACHPVVFGSDNLQYSADYVGVAVGTLEREMGGPTLGMFLQGGDGDINPYFAVHPLAEDAVKKRDWTGERLGRETARVARQIRTEPVSEAAIDIRQDVLDLEWRWNREKFVTAVHRSWGPESAAAIERRYREGLHAPVTTVLVNKTIAIMTVPGEPFVEHQIEWRNRCPVRNAFFAGYTNGSFGYLPTVRAAALGGYGAGNTATYVQPDAGARIVDRAIVRVYEMLGALKDVPEDFEP